MVTERNLIELEGEKAVLLLVRDIPGLSLSDHGQSDLGGGRFRLSARATDAAIAQLRARGVAVTVMQTGEEIQRQFEELDRRHKNRGE